MKIIKLYTLIVAISMIATTAIAQGNAVNYKDGDTKLQGYFAKAKAKQVKSPGIVIIHAWFGLTDHEKESANKLSALGYHALAADIYGINTTIKTPQEAGEKATYYKTNYKIFQSRIKAAIDEIIKQGADPDRIVVMGYCFGGTGALEAGRGGLPVEAVISFHGGLGKDAQRENNVIEPRVLVLHGADDPYVPTAEITAFQQEMRDVNADWQMIYYANAVHAFTNKSLGTDNSKGAAYNDLAAKRSWEHLKLFLKELFL